MPQLTRGSRVYILGGGPAGSFTALHLLSYSRQMDLDLQVTIYEPRSFGTLGVRGCNMCAGILCSSLIHNLARLGLGIPRHEIAARISCYALHTPHGVMEVTQPGSTESIFAVYRGCGPRDQCSTTDNIGLDGFLLKEALARGAVLRQRKANAVLLEPGRPVVVSQDETDECDLLIVATGVNSRLIKELPPPYRPPATVAMAQDELLAGHDAVAGALRGKVHIIMEPGRRLVFGSLIPKGEFISVSLLRGSSDPMSLEEFLDLPRVRNILPSSYQRSCGCKPAIPVGAAAHPFAQRMMVVGDGAASRLFKDGIGSAFRTARAAARTAVLHGVEVQDIRRHYWRTCRAITRDNAYGRLLFRIHSGLKDSRRFFFLQSRVIRAETTAPHPTRRMEQLSWGMFTGSSTYRALFMRTLSPGLWHDFASALFQRSRPHSTPTTGQGQSPTSLRGNSSAPRHILILGGGFGGVYTALHLEKRLRRRRDVSIKLVSDENYFLFTPLLHEVASGALETRHIAAPIRRLQGNRHFEFVQAKITGIDLRARQVHSDRGSLDYDFLVLALGSVTDFRSIAGKEHLVLGLKTLTDAMMLRNHIVSCFEEVSSISADPSSLLTFIVVGGGTTGVQLTADLNNYVREKLTREYTKIHPDSIRVVLLQDQASLLPGMSSRLSLLAREKLEDQGVEVHTNTRVTDVGPEHVELEGGQIIHSRTVVWTPGIVGNPVTASLPVPRDDIGRVMVTDRLEIPGYPGVFALGDNANQRDHRSGEPLPPTAHVAVRQPGVVAENIVSYLKGRPLRPYRYFHMGQMVSLGPRWALMELLGVKLHGFACRLLWQAAYSTLMKGRYNQVRVLTDWVLGLFFGRDNILLRTGPFERKPISGKDSGPGRTLDGSGT